MNTLQEDLTQHADFVVRLARSLSRPGDDAEAAAQEALLAAQRLGPGALREPKVWLATVVRRSLTRARRTSQHRQQRESTVARPETISRSAADQVAEIDLAQRLLSHVRALQPIYREVLFARYFEQQLPAEIARNTGESIGTIKTRIARGLELMRQRLDTQEPGGRQVWVSAVGALGAIGQRTPFAAGAGSTSSPAFKLPAKALAIAGIGVLVPAVLLVALRSPVVDEDHTMDREDLAAATTTSPQLDRVANRRVRTAQPTKAELPKSQAPAAPAQVAGIQLPVPPGMESMLSTKEPLPQPWSGLVADPRGEPLEGAIVHASARLTEGTERVPLEAITGPDGSFRMEPSLDLQRIRVEYRDWLQVCDIQARRNDEDEFDSSILIVAPRAQLRVRATYADGQAVESLAFGVMPDPFSTYVRNGHSGQRLRVDGELGIKASLVEVPGETPLRIWVPGGFFDRIVDGRAVEFEESISGAPILVPSGTIKEVTVVLSTDAELRVKVLNPDGTESEDAKVSFSSRRSNPYEATVSLLPLSSASTNPRVKRVLSARIEDQVSVTASVQREGEDMPLLRATSQVTVSGRELHEVTLRLAPTVIRGVVRGPDGPIRRASVELTPTSDANLSPVWLWTEKDGSFATAFLQPGAYAIAAESPEFARTEFGIASTGDAPLSLLLSTPTESRVQLNLRLAGTDLYRSEVWWIPARLFPDAPSTGSPLSAERFHHDPWAAPFHSGPNGTRLPIGLHRRVKGSSVAARLTPGLYRFLAFGTTHLDFGPRQSFQQTDALLSEWVEVPPGEHVLEVELVSTHSVSWEGQITLARATKASHPAGFHRIGIAVIGESGEPVAIASEGRSPTRFVFAGWQGQIFASRLPIGISEVWIGTEAQIEQGNPLARHVVEFKDGVNEFNLSY